MLFTLRGIPQMLYGTEIGMVGGESHVELRADYPGGFPGDERDAFTEDGRTAAENDIYDHIRTLLTLRQQHEALRRGRLVQYPPTYGHPVYTYRRVHDGDEILVVVNGDDEPRTVDLHEELNHRPAPVRLVDLRTGEDVPFADAAVPSLTVDRREALVLQVVDSRQ
jgi:glycosidase